MSNWIRLPNTYKYFVSCESVAILVKCEHGVVTFNLGIYQPHHSTTSSYVPLFLTSLYSIVIQITLPSAYIVIH